MVYEGLEKQPMDFCSNDITLQIIILSILNLSAIFSPKADWLSFTLDFN